MTRLLSLAAPSHSFAPQGLGWFARHELLLAWRDWLSMMTAGRRTRERIMIAIALLFTAGLHAMAYSVLNPLMQHGVSTGDKMLLVTVAGCGLLAFFMMLSQALESVTRAFYTRSDLELILSSPSSPRPVFAVRIAALTLTTTVMSTLLENILFELPESKQTKVVFTADDVSEKLGRILADEDLTRYIL